MTAGREHGFLIVCLLATQSIAAGEIPPQSAGLIVLRHCQATYERIATLGANQAGVLQKIEVKLGHRVKAGQVLGKTQDDDLRADLELKAAEASSDIEIRQDESTQKWNYTKLKMLESLRQKQFSSVEEYGLQKVTAENSVLAVEDAKHRRHLAELRFRVAQAGVALRQFISPIDGIVVQVIKTEGESIAWNDPVFRIVDPSVIRITGALDVTDAWRVRAGDRVRISPEIDGAELPIEHEEFTGRIEFVARELSAENQTCAVVALIENRGELLRSGLFCRMAIEAGSGVDVDAKPSSVSGARVRKPALDSGVKISARVGDPGPGSRQAIAPEPTDRVAPNRAVPSPPLRLDVQSRVYPLSVPRRGATR